MADTASRPPDRLLPAIGLRLVSVALFATMNAAIKLAERNGAALAEIMFFRQFGASPIQPASPSGN